MHSFRSRAVMQGISNLLNCVFKMYIMMF
jgi:hypothetical protein